MLAGTLTAVAAHAGAQEARANVTIRVHSCPDDLNATGFYQYAQRCHSTKGLFGVPLKFTYADGTAGFLYSQPNADETVAEAMNLPSIPAGPFSISEVSNARIRESVVFCSLQPAGNQPPTMDGTEVAVTNGIASFSLLNADSLDCDWYRFPGGVVGEGEGYEDEASPVASGGGIQIQKWMCERGDVPSQVDPMDPEDLLNDLESSCAASPEGFDFDLADDTEDGQDYPELTIGGADAGYLGWSGLVQAQFSISEGLSGDFDEPIVLCEGNVPGRETFARNLVLLEAHHGDVYYDLDQDETLTCEWFNVDTTGTHAGSTSGMTGGQSDQGSTDNTGGCCNNSSNNSNGNTNTDDGINDHDDDGIIDADEAQYGTDPNNADSDGDGVGDGDEITFGLDPLNPDTDGDGKTDGDEMYNLGTDPLNVEPGPSQSDSDSDGLADGDELNTYFTDPNNPDTDFDGLGDSDEVIILGTDPNSQDTDGDGVIDPDEVFNDTNPLDSNSN